MLCRLSVVYLVVSLNVLIFKDKIMCKLGTETQEITFSMQILQNASQKNSVCTVIW